MTEGEYSSKSRTSTKACPHFTAAFANFFPSDFFEAIGIAGCNSYGCRVCGPTMLLGIHIVQMDLAPRTSAFALVFPKYSFYVPNPRILGTRPVLPCKNGCCCKLELVEQRVCLFYGTVAICLPWVAHRWNCHTSKFGSCCAYRSGEIRVLRISHSCICFPWATDTVRSQLFSNS